MAHGILLNRYTVETNNGAIALSKTPKGIPSLVTGNLEPTPPKAIAMANKKIGKNNFPNLNSLILKKTT